MEKDVQRALDHYVPQGEIARLTAENKRLSAIERRFKAMLPLFEEARDAITVIPLTLARLHCLDLTLAARMDSVGIPEQWKQIDAASGAKP